MSQTVQQGQSVASRASVSAKGDNVCVDATARKVHQYTVVAVAVLGLLLGGPVGVGLLVLDGAVMLLGRFFAWADVIRQFVWRVAEPQGWLTPRLVPEDRGTRRVARALGGVWFWLIAAALFAGDPLLAWSLATPLCAMILFDATVDFCVLCFLHFQARRYLFLLTDR